MSIGGGGILLLSVLPCHLYENYSSRSGPAPLRPAGFGGPRRLLLPAYAMKIIPHGAAREVTGTCHEIRLVNGKRILLDCGLFQGHRKEAVAKNSQFSFEPAEVDAVILSHAHADHVGRIPLLYKRGYRGKVYCTYATKDLADVMLQDSGYIQEKDEEFFRKHCAASMVPCEGPLYTQADAKGSTELFEGHNYGDWVEVLPELKVQFLDAGHIIGAAMLVMDVT